MYRLYWDSQTGAVAPQILLEELGQPFELVRVRTDRGEHRAADYLAINPAGQIPALGLPEGPVTTESAAMMLLLGERHPEAGFLPGSTHPDRAECLRWLLFMASSVYMTFFRYYHTDRCTTESEGFDAVRAAAVQQLDVHFGLIDGAISGAPWFLAGGYGVLDMYLAMLVDWHPWRDDLLERRPAIRALCSGIEQREAFARTMAWHRG